MSTVLYTGLNTAITPCMAQAFQRMYITNDFDLPLASDDGTYIRTAGIIAPPVMTNVSATATGGSMNPNDIGTHLLRYRYYDPVRIRYSNPSPVVSVTCTSGFQNITASWVASSDAYTNNLIIEMTPVGASTFYQVVTLFNITTVGGIISLPDATLVTNTPSALYGDYQHVPPPLASIMIEHRQRSFWWGSLLSPGSALGRKFTGVTLTNGSATVTGTGFSPNWAGRQMKGADGNTYQIMSSTTTSITLTATYTGSNTSTGTINVFNAASDLLSWSRPGLPESTDSSVFARRVTMDTGDTPAGMASYYTDLYLFGTRCARRLVFTSDPSTGMVVTVPGDLGVFHQRCVCAAEAGLLFGWGRNGIWKIDAMQPQKISQPVETTLDTLSDPSTTAVAQRFCVYEPLHRQMKFFFQAIGDVGCKKALCYHLDSSEWTLEQYRNPMQAGCPNSQFQDRQHLMLSDINGYSWRVNATYGSNDGDGACLMTVGTGSTTTVILGTNSAQVGQIAYRPNTGEEMLVTVASGTQITVSPGYATTPVAGEQVYIGSIRQIIISNWFTNTGLFTKDRANFLDLYLRQVKSNGAMMGTIQIQFFKDFDDVNPAAIPIGKSAKATYPPGVSVGTGIYANSIIVNCDVSNQNGYFAIPIPCEWERSIRVQMIAEQPYQGVRFFDFVFRVPPNESAPVRNS